MCGGAHSALVVLPEAFSQVARTADVELSILLAQQNIEYFIEAPNQSAKKLERH
jgi:hypothetical protein